MAKNARLKCSDGKKCSDITAQIEKNAQIKMLSWKIMLRLKCSGNDAHVEKNAQMRCSDMLRTHLNTNNHYGYNGYGVKYQSPKWLFK